jgi:peptidoglycan/xylan/chitin deacetylase (PgdA/CDA1 family)
VKVTTIDEIVRLPASVDAVAITFDDAFVNFRDLAAPRLLAHGIPVTVFVATDHAGRTNAWRGTAQAGVPVLPILDWPALARLQRTGVAVGSHSRTHPDLTRLSGAQLEHELRGSAEIIETETGTRPTSFAYPYGQFDSRAEALVGTVYRFGCTVDFRLLDEHAAAASLPRLDTYYLQRPGRLETWGTPAFARFVTVRRRLRRMRRATIARLTGR